LLEKNWVNPDGLLKLMKSLQEATGSFNVEILSTHPIMENRIENIKSKIKEKKYGKNSELERIFSILTR
jgi:predicted Zn-dependent protease